VPLVDHNQYPQPLTQAPLVELHQNS